MRAHRRSIRLLPAIALLATLLVPGLAGSALATTTALDGTIVADDGVTWSADAVAVVTLVDMSAKPEAGAILGQQRIDDPSAAPVAFEVLYDDARVDPKGAYGAYATIVDGDSVYATALPVPVLTGGPDTGVELSIAPTLWEWKRGEGYTLPITHDRKAQVAAVVAERSFLKIVRFIALDDPRVQAGELAGVSRETFLAMRPIMTA